MVFPASQSLTFHTDGLSLSGVLHHPQGSLRGAIIGCHGLMANKNSPKQLDLAHRCNASGMAYFRFDHRGCGESEGNFERDTTLENRVSDLLSAHRLIRERLGDHTPVGLFGSSLGGTVCLSAAAAIGPFAMVTLAAPVKSRTIQLPPDTPRALKEELFQNRMQFDIAAPLGGAHHLLVIHGSRDETVSVENAHTIYALAQEPKQLLILDGGDHRITDPHQQETYMQRTIEWFVAAL